MVSHDMGLARGERLHAALPGRPAGHPPGAGAGFAAVLHPRPGVDAADAGPDPLGALADRGGHGVRAQHPAAGAAVLPLLRAAGVGPDVLRADHRRLRDRPALLDVHHAGLPGRHRGGARRPVGGGDRAEPAPAADLDRGDPAAGDPPGGAGAGQLRDLHAQGHTDADGDHRAGDAGPGPALLPAALPVHRAAHRDRRGLRPHLLPGLPSPASPGATPCPLRPVPSRPSPPPSRPIWSDWSRSPSASARTPCSTAWTSPSSPAGT
ncbi:hypothetical protein SGPA1_30185 [Streptomyces misionensis JCM 4497]